MDTKTQNKKVLEALERGETLTSMDTFHWSPAITRLSGRIYDLAHGIHDGTKYDIETIKEKNSSGKGYHARYRLKQPKVQAALFAPAPKSTAELWAL